MCPSPSILTLTACSAALLAMVLVAAIGHGLIRPLLEQRGITTWGLMDTVGAMPLVLMGAATIVGTAAVLLVLLATECPPGAVGVGGSVVLVAVGALWVRLGLHALRKLR
jgi:hypothetical protein